MDTNLVVNAVDRCQSLNRPSSGILMYSATSSLADDVDNSNGYVTSFRLICPRSQTLPPPVDGNLQSFDRFECDRRVGVWTPTNVVPSCVGECVAIEGVRARLIYNANVSE